MKKIALLLLPALAFIQASAQKLPKIQEVSLRAPTNAKADGKATEWVKMQAYNPTVELYYTIANDDKKLYLVLQSKNEGMLAKLVNGGITFLVQTSGKKTDDGAVGAKFPYMEKGQTVGFGWNDDEEGNEKSLFAKAMSKRMAEKIKWIYTKGLLIKDGPIAIYNNEGILAGAALDSKGVYTCEMTFDLNILGLSTTSPAKFAYHITVNGPPNKYGSPLNLEKGGAVSKDGSPVTEAMVEMAKQMIQKQHTEAIGTTDFWGEYTLAK
uniref:GLPGLI family protein n=1 Tax=uncultured bacterium 4C6 TaxID=1701323 RepID=A0A0N9HQ92_9BACT|nr:hypothetical protein [uncultured bacterium 4C6]